MCNPLASRNGADLLDVLIVVRRRTQPCVSSRIVAE
jgi:hypothetical protein